MEAQGFSARQLALRVGVHPSYVTRMLTGERNAPSGDIVERIAKVLNLKPDRLLLYAERAPIFLRTNRPLSDEDLAALERFWAELRKKTRRRRKRT